MADVLVADSFSSLMNQNFSFVLNYAHVGCFPVFMFGLLCLDFVVSAK